jgi:thimet oligopeptidase
MANFPQSSATKPSLLKHSDVTTFFHEFGHAIHALLGATEMASFSGTAVRRDFVEAPSQMLEKWMYELDILRKVSGHYQTGKPLPEQIIKTLKDIKKFDAGNLTVRQAFLSQLALDLFNAIQPKDTTRYIHELHKRMIKNIDLDPEYHMQASFGHLTGYGAKYYGYLWSNVFAADMFNEIKKHGLLNPTIGRKYKGAVLGKGGSAKPDKLLKNFLGREPNQKAFLEEMGLV